MSLSGSFPDVSTRGGTAVHANSGQSRAAAPRKLCAFGDQGVDNVRECLGRATVLSMNRAGLMLAFLAVPAVAIGVSGSVRIGLIVAVIEFGFQVLLRRRRQRE